MNTWKFTIKPASEKGFNAFKFCKENSYIGLGWSRAYAEEKPANYDSVRALLVKKYKKVPYQVIHFIDSVKENDHLWIHKNGKYYLCIAGKDVLYGEDISCDFLKYDLGHIRKVTWLEVPEIFVSGAIQRGVIAQRMIQKIKISAIEQEYSSLLVKELSKDIEWKPVIDDEKLKENLKLIDIHQLFSMMSPDDLEDIVSFYLQSKGWRLTKSTCFRSKPFFEFSMLNIKNETCYVQVKSGNNPNKLPPLDYKKHVTDDSFIYLFSTNRDAYCGETVERVIPIYHEQLVQWLLNNIWALTLPLKTRLWLLTNET
ncbi:hypothetical protein [Shewanella marina]|uniref:hypothetical protein n=1 Tax=Shewanella marina TaxID=487319 RepID=UPI00046EC8A2|nr:hypothetical protein [Shewanella marina]